jgi:hypothetical protein
MFYIMAEADDSRCHAGFATMRADLTSNQDSADEKE